MSQKRVWTRVWKALSSTKNRGARQRLSCQTHTGPTFGTLSKALSNEDICILRPFWREFIGGINLKLKFGKSNQSLLNCSGTVAV